MKQDPLILALPGYEKMAFFLAHALGYELGKVVLRSFPDGESYIRVETPVESRDIILFCSLDHPNDKIISLYLLSQTVRDLGAKSVGLVAPYLAYMRQDKKFHDGEGVTSRYVASLFSGFLDWLITVDPHLHRYHDLKEIYQIPTLVLHAAPLVASYIRESISDPLLIGPDAESEQWVKEVAHSAEAPYLVLQKIRKGDNEVEVSVPEIEKFKDKTPVLVDDIISTAHTMMETVGHLKKAGMKAPVCIGVHAIFAGTAYENLSVAGASRIITGNTIIHDSNAIDFTSLLVEGIKKMALIFSAIS